MCKKETAVSHSSTESDIISLDVGSRMDGLLALDLWDIVIEVLRNVQELLEDGKTPNERRFGEPF